MFEDTHSHLFNIAGSKDSCGDYMLRVLSGTKAPWLYGTLFDISDRSKAVEIFRRRRCSEACEVLRSGDENDHRLPQFSREECGVWEITGVDCQVEAVFDDRCGAFRCRHLDRDVRIGREKSG